MAETTQGSTRRESIEIVAAIKNSKLQVKPSVGERTIPGGNSTSSTPSVNEVSLSAREPLLEVDRTSFHSDTTLRLVLHRRKVVALKVPSKFLLEVAQISTESALTTSKNDPNQGDSEDADGEAAGDTVLEDAARLEDIPGFTVPNRRKRKPAPKKATRTGGVSQRRNKRLSGRVVKVDRVSTGTRLVEEKDDDFDPDSASTEEHDVVAFDVGIEPRRSVRERKQVQPFAGTQVATQTPPAVKKTPAKRSNNLIRLKKEKVEYTNRYRVKLGYTRFPEGTGPTKAIINKVFNILREHHAKDELNLNPDEGPTDVANAGPLHAAGGLTVDAFVMTVLAQSTTNQGGLIAHWVLRYYFPFIINGYKVMGKKPNYHAMRKVGLGVLSDILRPAGLQTKKAQIIKSILDAVHDGNISRSQAARDDPDSVQAPDVEAAVGAAEESRMAGEEVDSEALNAPMLSFDVPSVDVDSRVDALAPAPASFTSQPTVADGIPAQWSPPADWIKHREVFEPPESGCPDFFVPGLLSVGYLEVLENQALIDELLSHPGIGVKTAFCIGSFNLRRPLFAVDTHVFRLCKFLGWSPASMDENGTCELLDFLVDDNKKLALHQAFWHHGQRCGRCKSGATEKSEGWEDGCPIEDFVDRSRYIPQLSKAQKERQVEKAALRAEKDAVKAAEAAQKAAAKAEAKAKKEKEAAGQTKLSFNLTDGKIKVTKRKADDEAVAAEESQPRKRTKKVKTEEPEVKKEEEYDPDEYGKIRLHDDFDAGRNQNFSKTVSFKIPRIQVAIDLSI